MEIITLPSAPGPDAAVALGFFDGCHLGHQALLARTVAVAAAQGICPAVFTFTDGAGKDVPLLTDWEERLARFEAAGVVRVYCAPFAALREMPPDAFVSHVLLGMCGARAAFCGESFRYGRGGAGDVDSLSAALAAAGAQLEVVPTVTLDGQTVSSSALRAAVAAGDMDAARRMLGRPYALSGRVQSGKHLGRTLGDPTSNLWFPPGVLSPRHGVYRTETEMADGTCYASVTNVGLRPTVERSTQVNAETTLLGYRGDLYGAPITVRFAAFLREERKFASVEELQAQIQSDMEEVRMYHGE